MYSYSIRNIKEEYEEFTNFATSLDFPELIPPDEIWLAESNKPNENRFYIENSLKQLHFVKNGLSTLDAYNRAVQYEKAEREKVDKVKYMPWLVSNPTPPQKIYLQYYQLIHDPNQAIDVWIVDGRLIRDLYKTDWVEGGHGYVYTFQPNNQIWLDNALKKDELDYILFHEYTELKSMRDLKWSYNQAHADAAHKEFEMRKAVEKFKKSFIEK